MELNERMLLTSTLYLWFNSVLEWGCSNNVDLEIIPKLPHTILSNITTENLIIENGRTVCDTMSFSDMPIKCRHNRSYTWKRVDRITSKKPLHNLIKLILRHHFQVIISLGLLKLLNALMTFVGPLLLGVLVKYLSNMDDYEDDKSHDETIAASTSLSFSASMVDFHKLFHFNKFSYGIFLSFLLLAYLMLTAILGEV
jgi:hypothetical protein